MQLFAVGEGRIKWLKKRALGLLNIGQNRSTNNTPFTSITGREKHFGQFSWNHQRER